MFRYIARRTLPTRGRLIPTASVAILVASMVVVPPAMNPHPANHISVVQLTANVDIAHSGSPFRGAGYHGDYFTGSGYDPGYDAGYGDGYSNGYDLGYGHRIYGDPDIFTRTYGDSYNDFLKGVDYREGYHDGYVTGYDYGYNIGWDDVVNGSPYDASHANPPHGDGSGIGDSGGVDSGGIGGDGTGGSGGEGVGMGDDSGTGGDGSDIDADPFTSLLNSTLASPFGWLLAPLVLLSWPVFLVSGLLTALASEFFPSATADPLDVGATTPADDVVADSMSDSLGGHPNGEISDLTAAMPEFLSAV